MMRRKLTRVLAGLIAVACGFVPVAQAEPALERADVQAYIQQLVAEHGFDQAQLQAVFGTVKVRQDVIDKISRPAEKVWTWGRYKQHLVDADRINQGIEFWHQHQAELQRAAKVYGVSPEIILAILGIETRYGRITGSYPVIEALTTLGFAYPPRAKFFRKELTEALLLAREEQKEPTSMLGSYAGAMGYGQFIPSSYRHYAVDFDQDGQRDIWQNPVDAIGSIANYFARHRWSGDLPTALKVDYVARGDGVEFSTAIDLNSTVSQLTAAGMVLTDEQQRLLTSDPAARLYRVTAEQGETEYWLALHDFYVITRYNRSHLYALAVHHIATDIRQAIAESAQNPIKSELAGS